MRSTRRLGALVVVLSAGAVGAQDRSNSLEQEAQRHIGNIATLCGRVVEYRCQHPGSRLALEKPFSATGVTVMITGENRAKGDVPPAVEIQRRPS